jgi:hypothetical protein
LPIVLIDDEIVVWFDLNRSIDQQLANAKSLMKKLATERKPEPFRFQPRTYQRYLRLLDARAVGAKNSEIASILYPHLPNKYPEYDGNRQVRIDRRTAERLRDRDFLRIVTGGK